MTLNVDEVKITLPETTTPATPTTGLMTLYAHANKTLKVVDDTGQIKIVSGACFFQTSGVIVADTVSETSLLGSGDGSATLAANALEIGKALRVRVQGHISTTGTPTLEIELQFGGTLIATTGAVTMPSGVTDVYFEAEFVVVARTLGASGTVACGGRMIIDTAVAGAPQTGATTVDTTAAALIDPRVTWGTASASNTLTAQIVNIEILN